MRLIVFILYTCFLWYGYNEILNTSTRGNTVKYISCLISFHFSFLYFNVSIFFWSRRQNLRFHDADDAWGMPRKANPANLLSISSSSSLIFLNAPPPKKISFYTVNIYWLGFGPSYHPSSHLNGIGISKIYLKGV